MSSELDALVSGVLADLDGAGALADWLQEHDREREAGLLRRRWKTWQKARLRTMLPPEWAEEYGEYGEDERYRQDEMFREYVSQRFPRVTLADVTHWCEDWRRGRWHVALRLDTGFVTTACGNMMTASVTEDRPGSGVCRACRKALPRLKKVVPT